MMNERIYRNGVIANAAYPPPQKPRKPPKSLQTQALPGERAVLRRARTRRVPFRAMLKRARTVLDVVAMFTHRIYLFLHFPLDISNPP